MEEMHHMAVIIRNHKNRLTPQVALNCLLRMGHLVEIASTGWMHILAFYMAHMTYFIFNMNWYICIYYTNNWPSDIWIGDAITWTGVVVFAWSPRVGFHAWYSCMLGGQSQSFFPSKYQMYGLQLYGLCMHPHVLGGLFSHGRFVKLYSRES
jgi:hypothetical protein